MFNCRKISELISDSFGRRLSFRERFGLRMHLLMCGVCSQFQKLQHRIHDSVRQHGTNSHETATDPDDVPFLPEDSKSRIQIWLQAALKDLDENA